MTPPICIAILPGGVGGWGHRDVPQSLLGKCALRQKLVDVRYFSFFCCSGWGGGVIRAGGRGGRCFIETEERKGGLLEKEAVGGTGLEGVCEVAGAKSFLGVPKCPPRKAQAVPILASRGRCGRETKIARLRRLQPWSLRASCGFEGNPKIRAIAIFGGW